MTKQDTPDYENSREVYIRTVAKKESQYSIPQSERKFDFTKYAAINRQIIEKGLI